MNSLNNKTAGICKQIYDHMQAGVSQNMASRMVGKSGSWASRWLPIYLGQGGDLKSAELTGKSQSEREAELLLRIANDCEQAAWKVCHLFSFNWKYPVMLEVSMARANLHRSLRAMAQQLRNERKIILKEGKACLKG